MKNTSAWRHLLLNVLTSLLVGGVALAADASKPEQSLNEETAGSMDGVWLVQSAMLKGKSFLREAWTSRVTISGGSFVASKLWGSLNDVRGTFALHPETPNAIDLRLQAIDLSDIWEGTHYPEHAAPGIYRLAGGTLTLSFQIGQNPERPKSFVPADDRTIVLSLVRAHREFREFPEEVTVTVTDEAGRPAANAMLFSSMYLWKGLEQENSLADWKYHEIARTGADGIFKVAYSDLESGLAARDVGRKLTGFADVSPASLQTGSRT